MHLVDSRQSTTLIGDSYEVLLKAILLESYTGKRPDILYVGDFEFNSSLPTFPYIRTLANYGESKSPFDDIAFDAKQVGLLLDNTNSGYAYRGNRIYDSVVYNSMAIERISSEIPITPEHFSAWVPAEDDWLYDLEDRYMDKVTSIAPYEIQERLEAESNPVYSTIQLPKLLKWMGIGIANTAGITVFNREVWTINLSNTDGHFILYVSTKETLGYLIHMAYGRISYVIKDKSLRGTPADDALKINRHLMNNVIFKDIDMYTSISIQGMSEEKIIEMPIMFDYSEFEVDCHNRKQLGLMYEQLDENYNIKLIPTGRMALAYNDRIKALQNDPIIREFR